jgi:hypothetical protein
MNECLSNKREAINSNLSTGKKEEIKAVQPPGPRILWDGFE